MDKIHNMRLAALSIILCAMRESEGEKTYTEHFSNWRATEIAQLTPAEVTQLLRQIGAANEWAQRLTQIHLAMIEAGLLPQHAGERPAEYLATYEQNSEIIDRYLVEHGPIKKPLSAHNYGELIETGYWACIEHSSKAPVLDRGKLEQLFNHIPLSALKERIARLPNIMAFDVLDSNGVSRTLAVTYDGGAGWFAGDADAMQTRVLNAIQAALSHDPTAASSRTKCYHQEAGSYKHADSYYPMLLKDYKEGLRAALAE